MFAENLNPGLEPADHTSLDWALWRAQMALLAAIANGPTAGANPHTDMEAVHWIGELRRQRGMEGHGEHDSLVRSCEVWIRG